MPGGTPLSAPVYPPVSAPKLPETLKPIGSFPDLAQESIAEETTLGRVFACGGDCPAADFSRLDVRESRLEGMMLQGCGFEGASFVDVLFERCDFSGARFAGAYFERCAFVSCKMMGASFPDAVFKQVSADGGNFGLTVFDRSRLTDVCLRDCNLTEAALTEVRLKRFSAADCRFVKTSFFKTSLAGVDFRRCELAGPIVSQPPEELRGAVVNPAQAAGLASLLGVIVE